MAFLLRQFFCCLGKRVREPTIPDDRSRLIPASSPDGNTLTSETPGPNARVAFDYVRFNERLRSIVQSKGVKMVNVTSHLPFNIQNKPRALIDIMTQDGYNSSASRSVSTSTYHESQSPNPHLPHHHRPPPLRLRSSLHITPLASASQSRSPSLSRSHSQASLSSSHRTGNPEKQPLHHAVLGVRLVREYGSTAMAERRGRAKLKKDVDDTAMNNVVLIGQENPVGETLLVTAGGNELGNVLGDIAKMEPPFDPSTTNPLPDLSISPASDVISFHIQDIGAISASWGE